MLVDPLTDVPAGLLTMVTTGTEIIMFNENKYHTTFMYISLHISHVYSIDVFLVVLVVHKVEKNIMEKFDLLIDFVTGISS